MSLASILELSPKVVWRAANAPNFVGFIASLPPAQNLSYTITPEGVTLKLIYEDVIGKVGRGGREESSEKEVVAFVERKCSVAGGLKILFRRMYGGFYSKQSW